MVKFRLPHRTSAPAETKCYRCGNHSRSSEKATRTRHNLTSKTLIEFDNVEFEEKSRRIRVDFTQKPHRKPNASFNPVCYGLVQRRRNSRREITGSVMFFLLRMAFWLGVVCVLLPSGTKSTSADANI